MNFRDYPHRNYQMEAADRNSASAIVVAVEALAESVIWPEAVQVARPTRQTALIGATKNRN